MGASTSGGLAASTGKGLSTGKGFSMTTSALPEANYVEIASGHTVHYHDQGEGPVVLFVHGSGPGGSGYSNFKNNFPYFSESGFRTLVPDLLGYGLSSKPTDEKYTLAFLVKALHEFIQSLGVPSLSLVGNSLGGAISIQLALSHPHLVDKLVLMAPGGLEEREVYMNMPGIRSMLRSIFGPEGITKEGLRKVFSKQLFDPKKVTDDIIDERYQIAITQPQEVFSTSHVPNLAPELSKLQCPVFALWGMDDQFCPVSGARTIAEFCKKTRVLTLSECGHWVMVEHAALFNRLCVDFLREEHSHEASRSTEG
jgi:4,5:9,10-diseco-3-hydroxy-5,9,17-trioxoandrosta-1(10),2-diene-4-oate hydrolase